MLTFNQFTYQRGGEEGTPDQEDCFDKKETYLSNLADPLTHPRWDGLDTSPTLLETGNISPDLELAFATSTTDPRNHPRWNGLDTSPTLVETGNIAPNQEPRTPEADINTKYEITDAEYTTVSGESGAVFTLKPDRSDSADLVDLNGTVLSGDWSTTGLNYDEYLNNEWLIKEWSGPTNASLQVTGNAVFRFVTVHWVGNGFRMLGGYGQEDTIAGDTTSLDADNSLYRMFVNTRDTTVYYGHHIAGGEFHYVQWDANVAFNSGSLDLISFYRVDNGDGTVTLSAYQNGVKLNSLYSTSGSTTLDLGGGDVQMNIATGGSNGFLQMFDRDFDVSSNIRGSYALAQLVTTIPSNPALKESNLATTLLDPTY